MIRRVLDTLRSGGRGVSGGTGRPSEYDTIVAVSSLLLEMAAIDGEFSDDERKRILALLRDEFQLYNDDAVALMESAEEELGTTERKWQYASRIREQYAAEEKLRVVELLWRVVLADGQVARHEEYVLRKLAELLGMTDEEVLAARTRAGASS